MIFVLTLCDPTLWCTLPDHTVRLETTSNSAPQWNDTTLTHLSGSQTNRRGLLSSLEWNVLPWQFVQFCAESSKKKRWRRIWKKDIAEQTWLLRSVNFTDRTAFHSLHHCHASVFTSERRNKKKNLSLSPEQFAHNGREKIKDLTIPDWEVVVRGWSLLVTPCTLHNAQSGCKSTRWKDSRTTGKSPRKSHSVRWA